MKFLRLTKLLFMVLLFGMFFQIKAQSDSNIFIQKYNFSISSDQMNLLYVGVGNQISIAVSDVSADDLIVSINYGEIKKIGNTYVAYIKNKGETAISVSVKTKDGQIIPAGTMKFRVLDLPKPDVSWGLLENGDSVFANQLNANSNYIIASYKWIGCLEGVRSKINSFDFSILSKDAKIIKTIKVEGNKLNEEALDMLNEISSGNAVMIDRIIATGSRGKSYLEPIIIHIR